MLVAIAISVDLFHHAIQQLYCRRRDADSAHIVRLVGGDASASNMGSFLEHHLTGVVRPGHALLRSEARVGDRLYVTGNTR